MQISHDDIVFAAQYALEFSLELDKQKDIRALSEQNILSEKNICEIAKKHSIESAFTNKYSGYLIAQIIAQAISDYHIQLRQKLLESGIDIGEMDFDSTELRDTHNKKIKSNDE